jgi:hypothetical protein
MMKDPKFYVTAVVVATIAVLAILFPEVALIALAIACGIGFVWAAAALIYTIFFDKDDDQNYMW